MTTNTSQPIKLFNKLAIIDASYFLHRSLKTPDLWDLKNSKGVRTGGVYGFLRIFNSEIKNLDYLPVSVWDAGLAERRLAVYPNYKRNIDKTIDSIVSSIIKDDLSSESALDKEMWKLEKLPNSESTVADIMREVHAQLDALKNNTDIGEDDNSDPDDDYLTQYRRQRSIIKDILESLGIPNIHVQGWEGDDLMTLLTRISKQSIILTDDKDLQQLVSDTVDNYRPMAKEWIRASELNCTPRDLAITKAIVGDGSDNIPGVTAGEERKFSLGIKRAYTVSEIIRQHDEDPDKYLPYLESLNKNYYKGFIKNHDIYLRNMQLVDLSLVENDQSVINEIEGSICNTLGKGNLFKALALLGEQEITTLDTNGLLAKIMMVSPLARL